MKIVAFDLNRAVAGEPVMTKSGCQAEILKEITKRNRGKRLVVLITDQCGDQYVKEYFTDGPRARARWGQNW